MPENMSTGLNQSTGTTTAETAQTSSETVQTGSSEGGNNNDNGNLDDDAFLDGLFGDSTEAEEQPSEETTEEDSSESEDGEQPSQEETEEKTQTEEPFLKIKYNGEEENLTMEQAIELAQKGRNYDKKAKQYDDLLVENNKLHQAVNSKPMQIINQVASELGLNAEQFADYLSQYNEKNKFNQVFTSLKAKYPNADDQVISQLASAQLNNNYLKKQNEEAKIYGQEQIHAQERIENEIKAFHDKYPNVTDKELTDDVLEDVRNGMNVIEAYEKHLQAVTQAENSALQKQIEDLQKQLEATKTNNKVKQKSTGSLNGNGSNTAKLDPFLEGLFG